MKMLVLLTDAFGGMGGISKFNRDLLTALCGHPDMSEVVALPRLMPEQPGVLPSKLNYRVDGLGGKPAYALALAKALVSKHSIGGVLCGHINLLPLAVLAAAWLHVPLLLVIHGIDAWQPPKSGLIRRAVSRVDAFVSVSTFTKKRFLSWADLPAERGFVVPNCVELARFGPGPKNPELVDRYGLEGKTVLMTLSRLAGFDRHKGIDEVLEVLPALAGEIPNLVYLVAGDGGDRQRLEEKADHLGVAGRVIFAGYVPEAEKADHYRLADAYVMPGRGEGFGIVYLEALACGIPVVASIADGSREAVRDGLLGLTVDPDDPEDLKRGIRAALRQTDRRVHEGLDYFGYDRFKERWYRVFDGVYGLPLPATMDVG